MTSLASYTQSEDGKEVNSCLPQAKLVFRAQLRYGITC